MVTRNEVAERAGVSPSVVSYVLNNSNYVSEEKRKAVLKAVEELHYHPNYIGRSLKTKKTNILGLVCDDIRSELFAEITYFSEKYAYDKGYNLFLCTSHQEDAFLSQLVDHRLDGIFLATSIYSTEQINKIAKSGIPVALYGARHYGELESRVRCLRVDYVKAAYLLTERLIQRGFERIAFFPPYKSKVHQFSRKDYRYRGYEDALLAYNYQVDESLISYENDRYDDILNRAVQICGDNLEKYGKVGIVAGNDYLAVLIMNHLKKAGLYDPEKIAITGMDDTASSKIVDPRLTTVGFSKKDIARYVVDFLVEDGNNDGQQVKDIPVYLVEGESG